MTSDDQAKMKAVLTVQISGAHFSMGLYDIETGKLLPRSCRSIPVTYKCSLEGLIALWVSELKTGLGSFYITRCVVSGPMCLMDPCAPSSDAERKRYAVLLGFDLKVFFANTLGVEAATVTLVYSAKALLKGYIANNDVPPGYHIIALNIGTELTAAHSDGCYFKHLDWEKVPFLDGQANDYLTASYMLSQYYKLTEISLVNAGQLCAMRNGYPSAQIVINTFLNNLSLFLSRHIQIDKKTILILSGGAVDTLPGLRQRISRKLSIPVTVSGRSKEHTHLGAALLSSN